ncbi:MAG: enoyl-CoA hydratase/isomerase family protein, partial [Gemmatimonadales bacterium]
LFLGLADHFVPSGSLPALAEALEGSTAEAAVGRFAQEPPASALEGQRDWIDAGYAGDDAEEIVRRLRAAGGDAAEAADTIGAKSPTAVKVALASLRRVRGLPLEEALNQEYRVGLRFLAGPDFREGIRAQVVEKDRNPRWQPATLAEVGEAAVEACFESLGERELGLGGVGAGAQSFSQSKETK